MSSSDTAAPTAPPARPLFLPNNWLLSATADKLCLFGGVLVSFALYLLWQNRVLTSGHLVLIWVFVFHGPHFFATISRTYLDRTEWAERKGLFLGSLGWFLVGPALVGLAIATGIDALEKSFFFLAALWAYHHVVKQHFGFMALYRARAREFDRREFLFHKVYIIASLWMPALIVLSSTPSWLGQIPFVPAITAENATSFIRFRDTATIACTTIFVALQAAFALHLAHRLTHGRGINAQELGIVACSIALHWVAVRSALTPIDGDPAYHYAFVPLVTIYHNIQYHALVWHYNKAKYRGSEDAAARYGLATRVNRTLIGYAVCGLLFTLATIGIEHFGLPIFDRSTNWFAVLFAAAIWGWSFMHYYLDSKIWHVRQDAKLRKVLGFE